MTDDLKLREYSVTISFNHVVAGFLGFKFSTTEEEGVATLMSTKGLTLDLFQKLVRLFEEETGVKMEAEE